MNSPLLTCNLSFKFRFTIVMVSSCDAWLPVYSNHCVAYVCARIHARVYCTLFLVVKKFTFAISSPDELLACIVERSEQELVTYCLSNITNLISGVVCLYMAVFLLFVIFINDIAQLFTDNTCTACQ